MRLEGMARNVEWSSDTPGAEGLKDKMRACRFIFMGYQTKWGRLQDHRNTQWQLQYLRL